MRDARAGEIATVLESVIALSGALTAQQRGLFAQLDLSTTQLRALYLLAHDAGPTTPSRLAARLDVTPGAVTQLIEGLRAAQLVETAQNPVDARSRVIRLREAAAAEIAAFELDTLERMRPMFAGLGDDELRTLARMLARAADGG